MHLKATLLHISSADRSSCELSMSNSQSIKGWVGGDDALQSAASQLEHMADITYAPANG